MEARAGACRVVAGERLLCVRRSEAAPGPFRLTVNGDSMARTIALEARKNGALVGRARLVPCGSMPGQPLLWKVEQRLDRGWALIEPGAGWHPTQGEALVRLRAHFPGCSIRRVSETEGSIVLCEARRPWEARP